MGFGWAKVGLAFAIVACGCARQSSPPPAAPSGAAWPGANPPAPPPPSAADPATDVHAGRALSLAPSSLSTVPPAATIPTPAPSPSSSANTGSGATLTVPASAPAGRLGRDALEAPLRDQARFERCRIPAGTRVDLDVVVYNGAATNVDVRSAPNDRALNFCIERVVRETSWVKEPAVNRARVSF